eukprot:gb/GEZJ01003675.1/.p3 GENE.gb/GEZJ01003675.1/~~gb/GEZJ01003675.1/.p3  ORF type:complete len:109 (-),score=15.19 gb/GEZJ01003675.1/:1201-1527(-)
MFKERLSMRFTYAAESISWVLFGVCGKDFVCLYDWENLQFGGCIDEQVEGVYSSDQAHLLAIVGDSSFYVLQYSGNAVQKADEENRSRLPYKNVEDSFEFIHEVQKAV